MKIVAIKQTQQPSEQPNQKEMPYGFSVWLAEQIRKDTNNYTERMSFDNSQIEIIERWADAIRPDLTNMDLEIAWDLAMRWYNKERTKQYKTNKVVFTWQDGWRMVELPKVPLATVSSKDPQKPPHNDIKIEQELMTTGRWVNEVEGDEREFTTLYGNSNILKDDDRPQEGTGTLLYSLRDPENMPRATIELRYNDKRPKYLYVHEIFSNEELTQDPESWTTSYLHPRRNYIKDFFNYLKSQGYQFSAMETSGDDVKAHQLEDTAQEDQFGIPLELWGVGGSAGNYYDSLTEAYEAGGDRYWSAGRAEKVVDNVIAYAEARGELNLLEQAFEGHFVEERGKDGKMLKKWESMQDWANNAWFDYEDNIEWEHPYPEEPDPDDFIIEPQITEEQPEFKGMPEPKQIINQQAYEEAKKKYETDLELHYEEERVRQNEFEPMQFATYVYDEIQKAKARQPQQAKQPKTKKAEHMKTTITKIANKKINEKLPDGEQMALYVLTLKQYLKDNPNICDEWQNLIEHLPAPRKVRQDLSFQELKLLYETLEYLWEKITKQRIIPEKEILSKPETLMGNYLMMANGILLEGLNTYDIVKRNTALICSLLDINGMTIQEYLGRKPNDLVKFILKHGALRLFITKDKRFYAQCSPECYAKWARDKIRKLDFRKRVVKLIDFKADYKGWKSGISVIL